MHRQETLSGPGKRPLPGRRLTYEEFLEWLDEDTVAEWVDGEVVMASPVSARHQTILQFLQITLGTYVSERGLGTVLVAPFQVKLGPDLPGREPDLLFVSRARQARLRDTFMDGPPDVVVEVVSPESRARDREEKFHEYERAGVREYWLIDPERSETEFYRLDSGGRYQLVPAHQGVFRSEAVLGFWLRTQWLWEEPLPSPLTALAEVVGMTPRQVDAFRRALRGESP